ncbi:hypothetical protein BGZ67_007027 [Mortierella alpina]|nr:hypothetical protein BGZ67_007027 [Mortierella alpina]
MSSTDYRVSTIVVLCKDCGNDVGLYPGRHKCPPRPAMPSMPSIPSQYQQQPSSSSSSSFAASSSRSANGSNGRMRPADLNPNSLHASGPGSYGTPSPSFSSPSSAYGSRTPTSSSFQDRMGNGSRTPTASSFQDRMKERDREKQLREREEREAAARTIREGMLGDAAGSATSATATPAGGAGTTLWNRLKAAKEVINATITGEEKWPESDDSDYEGESHVTRVLREHADKKEDEEMAAKIAELDMMPTSGPGSKATGAGGTSRNQYLRDAVRKEPSTPSIISTTSSNEQEDYYGKSLRARGESTGVRADPTERSWSPASTSVSTNNSNNSYGSNNLTVSSATRNRYRTTSDASRDDALSRLEGKSEGDKLAAHVNNLGSTSPRARANSPNTGHRAQDPASSSSSYQQQQSRNQYPQYSNQLSPSSAANPNSYSSSSSQRSVSPGANRRYDPPSPNGSGRYGGGQPQPPVSPSYPSSNNNNYRQQAPPSPSHGDAYGSRGRAGGDPSQGRGRPEYDRRPTYPPQTSGGNGYGQAPGGGNNLGAYGQRQPQQQQQQQQTYQQYQQPYGASQGNYF